MPYGAIPQVHPALGPTPCAVRSSSNFPNWPRVEPNPLTFSTLWLLLSSSQKDSSTPVPPAAWHARLFVDHGGNTGHGVYVRLRMDMRSIAHM